MSDPYLCPWCDPKGNPRWRRHQFTCAFCQDDLAACCPACTCAPCLEGSEPGREYLPDRDHAPGG